MSTYRKGPVEVEARQLTRENGQLIWPWWKWADAKPHFDADHILDGLTIWTPSGYERVRFGDWIVKDAKGDFWPVKDDAYAKVLEQFGEAPR
ncbi:hypothetical protein ACIBHX_01745 [Nonomuraea sp. NPDC050536]|uniref:hypothetical protein n=1 Tax=Nonomuraea sp. NPDC050536 TaxID=3364366 RepID=UPI0037C95BE4